MLRVDLMIEASAANIERLRTAFRAVYDDPFVDDIRADDLLGDYPSVRYYPPSGDLYFDILTRLGEVARFDDVAAEIKNVEGSEDGFDRFLRHCARYRRLAPRRHPRGIFKFGTLEEARLARRSHRAGVNLPST